MPGFLAEHLYKPENRWLHAYIKTSIATGKPVSFLLNDEPLQDDWTVLDKKLLVGYQTLQDETCKSCGTPTWLGHTEVPSVGFNVDKTTCYSCAELEKDRETSRDKNAAKEHGVTKFPVPVNLEDPDAPVVDRRTGQKHMQ